MDVLAQYDAYATFFNIGNKVNGNPTLVDEVSRAGHEISNHTFSHGSMHLMSVSQLVNELNDTQTAIFAATGKRPNIMRAPCLWYTADSTMASSESGLPMAWSNGEVHDWEKQYGQNIEEAARKVGLALIDATRHQANDFDTDPSFWSPELILPWIINQNLIVDWGILLMHDGAGAGTASNTLAALPGVLKYLQEEGYEVLSVEKLLEKKKEMGLAWDLEPGRIYYGFDDIPEHVGRITIIKEGAPVSWFEEDDEYRQGLITVGMETPVSLTADVTTKSGGASSQEIYWYSDNKNVVTIDESTGLLSAVGWGNTTVRAVAGGKVASLRVTVSAEPIDVETITTWAEFNQVGSIPGLGDDNNVGGAYPGSGASYEIDSFHGYDNVLKLVPPVEGYPRAGIALTYDVPNAGWYTVSMDVYVEANRNDVTILWYDCTRFEKVGDSGIILQYDNLQSNQWIENTITGSLYIGKDAATGLLTRRYEDDTGADTYGLRNSTIYIKNFKIEWEGSNDPVIDIPGPQTPAVPVDKTVTLEWARDGRLISGDSITIESGRSITLTTAAVFPSYEWRVDGWEVPDNNGRSFVFDSTGRRLKKYNISLWVDGDVVGDAIEITVVEAK
jgi:peptidoglycan/xylan/chitin deacetylase (PgdA/CDA1 family)